MEKGALLDK